MNVHIKRWLYGAGIGSTLTFGFAGLCHLLYGDDYRVWLFSLLTTPIVYGVGWLLEEPSQGEKGVIPLKPLGVSADVAKRNAGSPRNPESLKKVVFTKEEYLEELDRNG